MAVVIAAVMVVCVAPATTAQAEDLNLIDGFDAGLDPAWTFRDGYALEYPADVANHAAAGVADGRLSLSFPGGAEHNQWWLRQAEIQRDYPGSGVYQIKVDSDFTGYQQVGLSFESSPGSFMHFMLYSNDEVFAYAERFSNVGGQQHKATVAGASTGRAVPASGPWYLRVTVDDDASPQLRTWRFEWSSDGVNWTTVTNGVLEDAAPAANAGAIQKVGIFTGNQPEVFSAFDGRIDYFAATSEPLSPPPPDSGELPVHDGLVLGLDASTLSGADGTAVSTWTGTGASASASGAARPTLITDGIGGRPSVRFDGVDDHLTLPPGFQDFTAGVTMFVVAESTSLQPGFKYLALGNGAGQHNIVLSRAGTTNGLQYFTTDTAGSFGWFNTPDTITTGQAQLISARQPGGTANATVTATVTVNGATIGTGNVHVPPVTTRSTNYIGQSYWNEGRFHGEIAEILVYNRQLDTTETNAVTTYLTAKYLDGTTPPPPPPPQPPAAPTGLAATAANATVDLTWSSTTGATGYRVHRANGGGALTAIADTTTPTYRDTTVTNDTTYTYAVTALNSAGQSPTSATVTATPTAPPPPPPPPDPGTVPTSGLVLGLDASTLSGADGTAVSTWTGTGASASASGAARPTLITDGIGGRPSVRFDGVDDHLTLPPGFQDFTAGVTMFVVAESTSLQPGFKYLALGNGAGQHNIVLSRAGTTNGLQYFTTDTAGSFGWFNTPDTITTGQAQLISARQPGGTANATVTATVTVNGATIGTGNVHVPPVTTRSTNYIGQSYWNEGRFHGEIAEILVYNRQLDTTETNAVTTYLTAKYLDGTTPPPPPPPQPPAAPTGLAATAANATVDLTWSSTTGATGYRVHRANGGGALTAIADTTTPTYRDTTVTNDTTYTYAVTALNSAGQSPTSATVTATPTAPPPPPPPPDPGTVPTSGLVLGLDASTLSGADGTAVSTWTGTGASASASGAARPTLITDGIGGRPSVRFDGVDDHLTLPPGFQDFTAGVTMFVVAESTSLQPGFKYLALGNGAGQHNIVLSRAGTTNGLQYFTTDTAGSFGWFNTPDTITTGQAQLISARQPGGTANATVTATVTVNGATIGTGNVHVPPVTTRSTNYIGQSYWNEGRFHGEIAEILVYNRQLDTTETNAVTTYLTAKYGLGA